MRMDLLEKREFKLSARTSPAEKDDGNEWSTRCLAFTYRITMRVSSALQGSVVKAIYRETKSISFDVQYKPGMCLPTLLRYWNITVMVVASYAELDR